MSNDAHSNGREVRRVARTSAGGWLRSPRGRGVLALAGGALVLATVAGCGSNSDSKDDSSAKHGGSSSTSAQAGGSGAAGSSTSSSGSGAQGKGSGSGSGSGAKGGSGSAQQGRPEAAKGGAAASTRCTSGDVKAQASSDDPGAGQENYALSLVNMTDHTCTLYGYPGVEFQNEAHHKVAPDPVRATSYKKSVITLKPGARAWAPLTYSNPEMSGAKTVKPAFVLVTPPDEKRALPVDWMGSKVPSSGDVIRVGTFSAGSPG